VWITLHFSLVMLHPRQNAEFSFPFFPHPLPTLLKGGDENCQQVRARGTARVGVVGLGCWTGKESLSVTPSVLSCLELISSYNDSHLVVEMAR
jgi:hypothetical protein